MLGGPGYIDGLEHVELGVGSHGGCLFLSVLLASDKDSVEFVVGAEILFVLEGRGGKAGDVFVHELVLVQIYISV